MARLALLCTLALSACANLSPRASSDLPQGNAPIPTQAIEESGAAHVVPGTLVVEDELGVRTPVRAGTIQFWLTARGGDLLEAAVHEGEFVLELPCKGELDVGPITIDGGSFWAVGSWEFGVMPERADLVARPVKPAFVQCIDAETGAPLSKGRVRRAGPNEWIADSFKDARTLASPFEVPLFAGRDDDVVRGWIGLRGYEISPTGYARRRVSIDPSEGGTRTFEFEKAATLRVRLWVEREDSRTHGLTVSDLNSIEYWQSPSFDGPPVRDPGEPNRWFHTLTIDDQPPGDYLVMPDAFVSGDGDPYGAVRVRVQAGDVVDVDFRPAEVPAIPRKFELQGTLRLIEGIDPARITLRFRPSNSQSGPSDPSRAPLDLRGDQFVMDRRDPEIAYWFAGSVPPGRWIASVPEVGWSQEFEHDSDAAVALELTQTPPSARQSVRFRVVEGRTGRALTHADIGVHVDGDPNPPGCVHLPRGRLRSLPGMPASSFGRTT